MRWTLFALLGISLSISVLCQKREDLEDLEDIQRIRRVAQSFNIDRDFFFKAIQDFVPKIVRKGISETTSDVTIVIRFATMLNLAR